MPCPLCADIPAVARANTGRDEYFTDPITSLKRFGLSSREDLWECPSCGALFHWYDDTSWTGSGNNDEEVLTRLPEPEARVARSFLHPEGRGPTEVDLAALLAVLPRTRELVVAYLQRDGRPLLAAFTLPLLDAYEATGNEAAKALVNSLAYGPEAQALATELARRPTTPERERLAAQCRRTLCSVCRHAPTWPTPVLRRAPPHLAPWDRLTKLGTPGSVDAWECPECASLFLWVETSGGEGTVSRLDAGAADALRACLWRQGQVSGHAIEMVFCSDGKRSLRLALAHGLRKDRELVRQLVPRAVQELQHARLPWLRDALQELALEPDDARWLLARLDEAATKKGPTSMLAEVAAHCRDVLAG